jgi:hypothetical protein
MKYTGNVINFWHSDTTTNPIQTGSISYGDLNRLCTTLGQLWYLDAVTNLIGPRFVISVLNPELVGTKANWMLKDNKDRSVLKQIASENNLMGCLVLYVTFQ